MATRLLLALWLVFVALPAAAAPFTPAESARVDDVVAAALARSGIPAASVAVVRDGDVAFAKAYGEQAPGQPARADARYPIASVSKQFVAAALLILEDEGKLSLNDPVARYLPQVKGGERITIRQLLAHSGGLTDYWPHDYAFADMAEPVTPAEILRRWASQPPEFAAGTDFRYSNTGYVAAGLIVEKVAGAPLMEVLRRRLFAPLGLTPVDMDEATGPGFPAPAKRYALGPVRAETPAARGWLYAAGGLAMSATDLARWNLARLQRRLLPRDDWEAQETPQPLSGDRAANYGLGVVIGERHGQRSIEHSGEAVGFLSQNIVLPERGIAVTVLVNGAFGAAQEEIAEGILAMLLAPAADDGEGRIADARALLDQLREGRIDPAEVTPHLAAFFTPEALADYSASLGPLGAPAALALARAPNLRGGFVQRVYTLTYPDGRRLVIGTFAEPGPHGRWEQFLVTPGS